MASATSSIATEQMLDRFIHHIVEAVSPLRILLFGSRARADAGPASDVDLLVVVPDGSPTDAIARRLYRDIPREGTPLDVIVTTPALLQERAAMPGQIFHTILKEGREVYRAA